MAVVYTQTWTDANNAPWPLDFTTSASAAGGTIDIQSSAGRMITNSTAFNTQRAVLSASHFQGADAEVLIFATTQIGLGQAQVILRGSGTWDGSETDSPTVGYKLLLNMVGNQIAFYKRTGGVTTQVGTNQAFAFANSTSYWIRYRVEDTTLTATVWNAAGSEPGSPTYQQTDATIASIGQFMMTQRTTTTAPRDLRWDTLSIDDLGSSVPVPRVVRVIDALQAVKRASYW